MTGAAEAPGANCPAGGTRYTAANGARYVCNGSPEAVPRSSASCSRSTAPGSGLDADTVDGVNIGALFGTGSQTSEFGTSGGGVDCFMGQVLLTATNYPPPGFAFAAGQTVAISQY